MRIGVVSCQKFRLILENVTGISEMTCNFASVLVFLTQFWILFWNCA